MLNKDPNPNTDDELKDILAELEEAMTPEGGGEIETSGEVKPVSNSKPIEKPLKKDQELIDMLDKLDEDNDKEEPKKVVDVEIVKVDKTAFKTLATQRELKQEIAIPDDDDDKMKRLLSKALVIGENVLGNIDDDRAEVDRCLKMIFDKAMDDNKVAIEQVSQLLNTKAQINNSSIKIMDSIIKLMATQKKNVQATQTNNYNMSRDELDSLLDQGKDD